MVFKIILFLLILSTHHQVNKCLFILVFDNFLLMSVPSRNQTTEVERLVVIFFNEFGPDVNIKGIF